MILSLVAIAGVLLSLEFPSWAAAPVKPGTKDRCQVCGMFVAPFPTWLAVAELKDGRHFYFDGPKDLFIFAFDIPTYLPGGSRADVVRLLVTEYYSAKLLPVEAVVFVVGSDVLGPMGQELVPVEGEEKARTFRRDHGGTKFLRYDGNGLVEVLEH
jgi:nitrous oxide reductase accessory protein NosL